MNIQYTTSVEICVVNMNFWWGFNGLYMMVVVCLAIQDVRSNYCIFICLIILCTSMWIIPTSAFLSTCESSNILSMTIVEVFWSVLIMWSHFYIQNKDRPPPLAEPLDAPVAVPASGTRSRAVQAREADLAECV